LRRHHRRNRNQAERHGDRHVDDDKRKHAGKEKQDLH